MSSKKGWNKIRAIIKAIIRAINKSTGGKDNTRLFKRIEAADQMAWSAYNHNKEISKCYQN